VLTSYGRYGTNAYDLVDRLPPGEARAAAWNAFVCQTYGDKLAEACRHPSPKTTDIVRSLYALALGWLDRAASGMAAPLELPTWDTPVRSYDELVGMRNTLDALRTYVAYGLPAALAPQLADVDARIDAANGLWIKRPTPELRGGIGFELIAGIRVAISLGRLRALGA